MKTETKKKEPKLCCPKCKSESIRSYDNESLYHDNTKDAPVPTEPDYDNEVYIMFECFGCRARFTKVFELVLKY